MNRSTVLRVIAGILAASIAAFVTFALVRGSATETVHVLRAPSAAERWSTSDLERMRADCARSGAGDLELLVGEGDEAAVGRYCTCIETEAQKDSGGFDRWVEDRSDSLATIVVLEPCAVAAVESDRIVVRG